MNPIPQVFLVFFFEKYAQNPKKHVPFLISPCPIRQEIEIICLNSKDLNVTLFQFSRIFYNYEPWDWSLSHALAEGFLKQTQIRPKHWTLKYSI